MLTFIHPKLPMRDPAQTKQYYTGLLGFEVRGDYGDYLILGKDHIELHFFEYKGLVPEDNYGQVYIRTDNIGQLYQTLQDHNVTVHPNGHLSEKPWGQKEFALLDPDHNLLTFGQSMETSR